MSKRGKHGGGPKTPEGKAIVARNAVKHGIMARSVILPTEKTEDFESLMGGLYESLSPMGRMEELLVRSIAIGYWRLERVYKYERYLFKKETKKAIFDIWKSTRENEKSVEDRKEWLEDRKKDLEIIRRVKEAGGPIEETFSCDEPWDYLKDVIMGEEIDRAFNTPECRKITEEMEYLEVTRQTNTPRYNELSDLLPLGPWGGEEIYRALLERGMTDKELLDRLLEMARLLVKEHRGDLKDCQRELKEIREEKDILGVMPTEIGLDKIRKYEGSIQKGIYKALNQLERLQRMRAGEGIPAPLAIDLTVGKMNSQKSLF